jgi:MYXO-CTERM domain-containing protein
MQTRRLVWIASVVLGCGGGGSGSLDGIEESPGTEDDMIEWADSASAPAVYGQALTPLILASFAADGDTCPVIVEEGTTTTYTGGCTDMEGNEWVGSAVADTEGVVYDGFGFTGEVDECPGMTQTLRFYGSVTTEAGVTGNGSFTIDVRIEGSGADPDADCAEREEVAGIDYEGTVTSEGEAQTYSGSGRIGSSERGYVDAVTEDETVDDSICSNEALSGTTTITAGGHTAVITYDGATDCEETSTVTWTYDGEDRGELSGIQCSSGGGAGGAASLLLIVGAAMLRRRRRD